MRKRLVVMLTGTMWMALHGASAHAADLLQVYQMALANDAQYTSARYALEAGKEKSLQGLSVLLPKVGVSGSYTKKGDGLNDKTNTYTLALTQPLFRLDSWETFQQGKLAASVSELQFAKAQQDLLVRVSQAYFDVLSAQDALTFLEAQKKAIEEQLASAKRNFEVGTATITDTNEAQARYDLVIAQDIAARSALDMAQNALFQITGQPAGELSVLRKDIQLSAPQPSDINSWITQAGENNFDVMSQVLNLEIAQSKVRGTRAGHLPTVDLQLGRTYTDQESKNSPNNPLLNGKNTTNAVSIQWTIPLFAGMGVTSATNEAIATREKTRADTDYARRGAVLSAQQAYLGVTNGLSQIKAYEAAEVSSMSAVESNRLGYQVGVRINIDVLNAQQQLFSTRRDLSKARYDTLINSLKLRAAAGTLKEEDLHQVNSLLTLPQIEQKTEKQPSHR